MAADLFKTDAVFRALVRRASERTGSDLEKICLRGPERELTRTKNLQPLLVCISLGYLRHLTDNKIQPDKVLGHSLLKPPWTLRPSAANSWTRPPRA